MSKDECTKELLAGNNSLDSIIVRVDFLTIDIEKIIEEIFPMLGDEYKYNQIDSYDINLEISDPQKLITQDFIKQKVNLKNNYEFKNMDDGFRFILNKNFFLYERRNFYNYAGSEKDTQLYLDILNKLFEATPKIQRLGVRKTNVFFIERNVEKLKGIVDNAFIKALDDNVNQKLEIEYTPLEENQKDGYNMAIQVDYGKLKREEIDAEVYRIVLDIDSYIREQESIDSYDKIQSAIAELKEKDFKIYKEQMSEAFLEAIKQRNKDEFKEKIKNLGILHGVNYGKDETGAKI